MSRKLDSSFLQELAMAPTYRSFLSLLLQKRGAKAQLCRRAGFTSRSYLSELVAGKKGLSRDALSRVKTALNLPKPLPQLFENLVYQSEPSLRPSKFSEQSLQDQIAQIRHEVVNQVHRPIDKAEIVKPCVKSPQLFQVYAALGLPSEGASEKEVSLRTGLSPRQVNRHLKQLLELKAITQKGDRYFAPASQADNINMEDSKSLSEMVRLVSQDIQKNRDNILSDLNSLTVYSAFSVQKNHLPQLKKKLQAAIYGVLDEYQDDRGNCVQQIFISLHGNPFVDSQS